MTASAQLIVGWVEINWANSEGDSFLRNPTLFLSVIVTVPKAMWSALEISEFFGAKLSVGKKRQNQ